MTSQEDRDQQNATAPSPASTASPPPSAVRVAAQTANLVVRNPLSTPKPERSWPVSMMMRPANGPPPATDPQPPRFVGELTEGFDAARARVEGIPAPGWFAVWRRRFSREAARTRRVVAFDGFRNDLYDEKLERDRRYGTVYTVVEEKNAYLVRLEMPRRLASSALRATWNVPSAMPDYDYTIALTNNVLIVKASVPGEALRRLSYVSTSFPADFMTRIEFARLVDGFSHRLRDKVLEIIVFTRATAQGANQAVTLQP